MELHTAEEAEKQNTTKVNIIKAVLKCERESSIFPLLRQWISSRNKNAIDELWTPDNPFNLNNTTWSAVIKKEAIFKALIKNGKQHFSQAMDTPFASGPVANLIGPFEFNEYSQQILKGEFDIESITNDIELHNIVKAMAHSDPSNPIESNSELTINKLCEGFSYIKEGTASNPDGLHHGHWKTLIKDDDTFEPYALMIMFAFKFGEPPHTWTSTHQVMLGKDEPGQPIKITCIHQVQLCAQL